MKMNKTRYDSYIEGLQSGDTVICHDNSSGEQKTLIVGALYTVKAINKAINMISFSEIKGRSFYQWRFRKVDCKTEEDRWFRLVQEVKDEIEKYGTVLS